jgi:hypothetical protein
LAKPPLSTLCLYVTRHSRQRKHLSTVFYRSPLSSILAMALATFLCLIAALLSLALTQRTCYTPTGLDRNSNAFTDTNGTVYYVPCNPTDGTVSVCCRITDTCWSNGLCLQGGTTNFWRESCTDPTFTHPNCIKLYLNDTMGTIFPFWQHLLPRPPNLA